MVSNLYLSLMMSPDKEVQLIFGRSAERLRRATSKLELTDDRDDRSYISHDSYFDVKFELKMRE